jgi:hypothetical protein
MLRGPAGTTYEVSLTRDGQALTVTLALANLYD